jgi:CheY-like chemotaxis protein
VALRLSIFDLRATSLIPILFVSNATSDIYHGYKYSPIILTGSIAFEAPENVSDALEAMGAMSISEYKSKFLNVIKILPNASEGRHSLANQWGADVLHRIVLGTATNNALINKARLSIYFRYTLAQTLTNEDLVSVLNGGSFSEYTETIEPIEAAGKKILLIDDEADKGWSDVLSQMLKGAIFTTVCEKVSDYEELSEKARKEIENGDYDLIFLDLRMNGPAEENVLQPEDFSGMKILKRIKALNKGTQVIMFTASNKAWNMKALLDAGADGYYIKESPEYIFSRSYSISNANELKRSIIHCLHNGYLRYAYSKIIKVKKLLFESNSFGERTEEILASIDVAYDLLAISEDKAEYKAYAYLQFFLTIEELAKLPSVSEETETGLYLNNHGTRYRILKKENKASKEGLIHSSVITMENGHYIVKNGIYMNRFVDTNYIVSSLLLFKFGQANSAAWTKIYQTRNKKAAHPKTGNVSVEDIDRILDFMLFFFDSKNEQWRDVNQAFPDVSIEDLKSKWSCK